MMAHAGAVHATGVAKSFEVDVVRLAEGEIVDGDDGAVARDEAHALLGRHLQAHDHGRLALRARNAG